MPLFPSIFCTISAFSLYGEYVVRSFLPMMLFFYLVTKGYFLDISLCENSINQSINQSISVVVVVVVVVFTLTDRASTIPSNIRGCQSGTWSQRGTKVNGSHHGDNPLLRPTGIQIATKSYATLQAMAPTNSKTVHQTSFTPYREQPRSTRIVVAYPRPAFSATNRTNTFQPVLINNSKFLKATNRTKMRKIEIPRSRSTPVAQLAPRNLLTRWDVSSIPANGIFLTKN